MTLRCIFLCFSCDDAYFFSAETVVHVCRFRKVFAKKKNARIRATVCGQCQNLPPVSILYSAEIFLRLEIDIGYVSNKNFDSNKVDEDMI